MTSALGYLLGDVWFAGDTDLHAGMDALRGRVTVALVPIWGWGPSIGPGHLDPGRAARAVALVGEIVIPIHWGTFLPAGMGGRHRAVLVDPAREFEAQVMELAPATRVLTLAPDGSPTAL